MAVMTDDTFDPLRRYVGVRLQQGVPIADSDWNELDDAHELGLRAPARWFFGDGAPEGTDGFRIEGTGLLDDFFIRAGVTGPVNALSNVGRSLVDGQDVTISGDFRFTSQPLYIGQPGSAALATALGVPQIMFMPNPVPKSTVMAYLDVWERLVTATEDQSLVHPGLGTETCARLKREAVVRVRPGSAVPVVGDADFLTGHGYFALATIDRDDAVVSATDVIDVRERQLLLPPATLATDLFGTAPTEYRRGRGRPLLPLREGINALLRGDLPGTSEAPLVTPSLGADVPTRAFFLDNANGLVAVWHATRPASTTQVFVARLDLNNVAAGFGTPVQVPSFGTIAQSEPHAAVLPNGQLIIAYQVQGSAIRYRQTTLAQLSTSVVFVMVDSTEPQSKPFVVISGDHVVFLYHLGGTINRWHYRRRRTSDFTFLDAASVILSSQTTELQDFHAARDAAGNVWAFYRVGNDVRTVRLAPATGTLSAEDTHRATQSGVEASPFVLPMANGDVWLFWSAPNGLHSRRFRAGAFEPIQFIPMTIVADRQPCAVEDVDGVIWLYWARSPTAVDDIMVARRDPVTGGWSAPRQLTGDPNDDSAPFALIGPDRAHYLFWSGARPSGAAGALDTDVFFRRLFPAL